MFDLETLLPPNASDHERDLEHVTARVDGLGYPIGTLWDPDRCPENLLPFLAWALSVEEWDANWSVSAKRGVIKASVSVHRKKGTVGAIREALDALGMRLELAEWFEYGGEPHTFRLDVLVDSLFDAGFFPGPKLVHDVNRVIDSVKPVRSHYDIRIGDYFRANMFAKTGYRQFGRETGAISFDVPTRSHTSTAFVKTGQRISIVETEAVDPIERNVS